MNTRLLAAIASVVTLLGIGIAHPAVANPPNQSDVTGTNVFNSVAPDFFDVYGDRLDPETLVEAERLSNRLDDSYAACLASAEAARSFPRRFARGSSSANVCTSPDCMQFESLLRETRQFLSNIDATTVDLDQFFRDRPW